MADATVGVINQSTATVAPVDVSQLTNAAGAIVDRQRIIIGDNNNPNAFLDIDPMVRTKRQMAEITSLETYEHAINLAALRRGTERGLAIDRRGGTGRGSTR
jgi:hypothetical protein